jgi:hypothetical protein
MRKWGVLISVFYALIVLALLVPVSVFLIGSDYSASLSGFLGGLKDVSREWVVWVMVLVVLSGQGLLLFLSVDTSPKRLKPRAHVLVSVTVTAMLLALLAAAVILSLGVAICRDKFLDNYFQLPVHFVEFWLILWLVWGIIFYWYARNSSQIVTKAVSWLLKGSVLELLVAVPCHIIVRRRHDCSAPAVTSFGIATGIAIMLLSFGPSLLLLYKKRLAAYTPRSPQP